MINVSNTYPLTDGVKYALLAWSLHPEHSVNQPNMKILSWLTSETVMCCTRKYWSMPTQRGVGNFKEEVGFKSQNFERKV